ncbi:MAG: 1-acyl-sn-glycerol-3-phosphate acyltransferase, partial [Microthrixaceae bacterium]
MAHDNSRAATIKRRARNVGGLFVLTTLLTVLIVPIILLTLVADLVLLRFRLPVTRLVAFALCWSWLETAGVLTAAGLWLVGRGRDHEAHYRLQRWWAGRLLASLRVTCGLELNVEGAEVLSPGPVVLLVRHASLADSLVTAWVVTELGGLHPRFVLKDELLADPCLDIVGNRLANCFIDRNAADAEPALAAIARLGAGMTASDAAIIFPEGPRSNDAKRLRALDRIAAHDQERAERLAELRHLLPPRPSGTRALVGSALNADIVVGCHV